MNKRPSGNQRRDAARPTAQGEATTAKVAAALASREEAAKLRRRLLEMIVDNEQIRRQTSSELAPSTTQV